MLLLRLKAVVRKLELQELVAQVDAPRPALQVVAHAPEEFPEPRVLRALMGATSKKSRVPPERAVNAGFHNSTCRFGAL